MAYTHLSNDAEDMIVAAKHSEAMRKARAVSNMARVEGQVIPEWTQVLDALETLEIAAFTLQSRVDEIDAAVIGNHQTNGFPILDEHPSTLAEANSRMANATAAIERATAFLNRFF